MLFQNICSDVVVMLLGYKIAGISRKLESERKQYALPTNAAYLNTKCHTCLVQKNLKQWYNLRGIVPYIFVNHRRRYFFF